MRRALAAGVRIALGTDAGYTNCLHGQNAYELELFVQEGMTPMQAIVAATSTAAECVRLADAVGTLRRGFLADILLVEGDPLADISLLRQPERLRAIFKDGRAVKNSL
jgi:imidazolonepropionase-like amidohydrolase